MSLENPIPPPPPPPPPPLEGGSGAEPQLSKIEFDDLEFMDTVGSGGFGQVWKGRWSSENKIVAIKKVMQLEQREASCCS